MKGVKRGMDAGHSMLLMSSLNRRQEGLICRTPIAAQHLTHSVKLQLTVDAKNVSERRHRPPPNAPPNLPASLPEHQVHQLKPLPLEEALPIGWQHEAGAQGVEEVLHHLLFLRRGRVVTFEHLWRAVGWGWGRRDGFKQKPRGESETASERLSHPPRAAAATRQCPPSRPATPCYLPRRDEEER